MVLNKAASIEHCLARISEEYGGKREHLYENQTKQDAIVLNLQRACETAIDLAMYVVRRQGLDLPQESRDAFALLEKTQLLSAELAGRLQRMVGFRNVAVHEYTRLSSRFLCQRIPPTQRWNPGNQHIRRSRMEIQPTLFPSGSNLP